MVQHPMVNRRRFLGLLGAAGALPVLSACGSSVGGGGTTAGGGGTVKVGLVVPQSGVYAPLGTDMKRGWDLWLADHGSKFGELHRRDRRRRRGRDARRPACRPCRSCCRATGSTWSSASSTRPPRWASRTCSAESKKLLIVTNAGAERRHRQGPHARTSGAPRSPTPRSRPRWASTSRSRASPRASTRSRPTTRPAPRSIAGFTKAFETGGGTVVGEAKTAVRHDPGLPAVPHRHPELRGAGHVLLLRGRRGGRFVKQYAQFGLSSTIPLYGSGFLTEGSVLPQQGDAAVGVQTTLHYTDQLDNPANKEFVQAYTASTASRPAVLGADLGRRQRARPGARHGHGRSTATRSPRRWAASARSTTARAGPWTFDGQTPRQNIYLRKVDNRGGTLVNAVVQDLGSAEPAGPCLMLVSVLNGLAIGLLLFILAVGLSLVFGMMDVLNLAHGALFLAAPTSARAVRRRAGGGFLAALASGGGRRRSPAAACCRS